MEASQNETRERLRGEIDREYAPAWIPEKTGEEVCGVVAEVKAAVPTKKGPVPVVTLELDDGGALSVWLVHTALRRSFARANVDVGETVLIRYLGRVEAAGGGEPYFDYRLAVDRPRDETVDWRAIAGDEFEAAGEAPPADPSAAGSAVDEPIDPRYDIPY